MTEKTACTGRLLWTRLESDYSPENKNGFQVAHVTGLSAEDVAIVEKMVTPWDYKTPVRSVALPGERIAVAVFGSRDPERTAKIKHAIDEGDRLSDRQTDNKVIRLPRRVAQ
jgi:hypothetical protein